MGVYDLSASDAIFKARTLFQSDEDDGKKTIRSLSAISSVFLIYTFRLLF